MVSVEELLVIRRGGMGLDRQCLSSRHVLVIEWRARNSAEILRLRGSCSEAESQVLVACEELRPYLQRELGWPLNELGRIAEHHPELGEHLSRTIRTGTYCAYLPDPRALAGWKF